jgi:hypothetical protein
MIDHKDGFIGQVSAFGNCLDLPTVWIGQLSE